MFKCIGCDRDIGWDGKGSWSYTCGCGARVFYEVTTGNLALPALFILAMAAGQQLPHLDNLVGESDYSSPVKESFIQALRDRGSIWMEECEQCQRDGTLQRHQEREKHLAIHEAERIIRAER